MSLGDVFPLKNNPFLLVELDLVCADSEVDDFCSTTSE